MSTARSSLLLPERPLYVLPSLVRVAGLNEALLIQQLHWALGRDTAVILDDARWLRADLKWWGEQFPFFSESTIRRALQSLKDRGFVRATRGRESNVYTIDYVALEGALGGGQSEQRGSVQDERQERSDRTVETGQDEHSPCKRPEPETCERETASAADAAGDGEHLPGLEPPPAPLPPPSESDAKIEEVWAHYAAVFADRIRIKDLTDPRRRTVRKGLKAVDDDVELCKRAIDGLKSYRTKHPDGSKDVGLGVIFETGPQSRTNLTDQIEWWAGQAADQAAIPPSVPSGHRGRVMDLAAQVLKVEQQPDNQAVRERGEQAQAILLERFRLKIISDGSGRLVRFEGTAA